MSQKSIEEPMEVTLVEKIITLDTTLKRIEDLVMNNGSECLECIELKMQINLIINM